MKPEQDFKLMSLNGHHERQCAYLAALALNDNVYEDFEFHVVRIGTKFGKKNIPRFLRLVADALKEKASKFDLTPTGWAIVKAWRAAYYLAGRTNNGFDSFVVPMLLEVKTQYAVTHGKEPPSDLVKKRKWIADLERNKQMPSDQTFRKTLRKVKLWFS